MNPENDNEKYYLTNLKKVFLPCINCNKHIFLKTATYIEVNESFIPKIVPCYIFDSCPKIVPLPTTIDIYHP